MRETSHEEVKVDCSKDSGIADTSHCFVVIGKTEIFYRKVELKKFCKLLKFFDERETFASGAAVVLSFSFFKQIGQSDNRFHVTRCKMCSRSTDDRGIKFYGNIQDVQSAGNWKFEKIRPAKRFPKLKLAEADPIKRVACTHSEALITSAYT